MITWIEKKIIIIFLPILICFQLTGCMTLGESFKVKQSISEYAEQLFKRQNFLTQQVMMLFEVDITEENEKKVYQAESQMHDACHLLNEYATREMDGIKMSVFFRKRVQSSFDQCEETVKKMESILGQIEQNNGTAKF